MMQPQPEAHELGYIKRRLEERYRVSLDRWPHFMQQLSRTTLKKGGHWVRAGDRCMDFLCVSKGLLRTYLINQQGEEVTEGFYEPGMLLGPISCFLGDGEAPCPFHVQAVVPSTVWVADYAQFRRYAVDKPDLLSFEIRFLQDLIIRNAQRDAKRLLGSGESRYRWFCSEYAHLLGQIPLNQVASFLGMTPVSISRQRRKMSLPRHDAQMDSARRVA